MRSRHVFAGIFAFAGISGFAYNASAGYLNVELKVNGTSIWTDQLGTASNGWQAGSTSYNNPSWVNLHYANVTWDSDPIISYDFSIQNPTNVPQQYTLIFSTNVTPALSNPFGLQMNGSISGGGLDTFTNDAFTAAQAAAVGGSGGNAQHWAHGWIPSNSSHYRAYIDGNLVRTLYDDPNPGDGLNHLLWWGGQGSTPSYGPASFGQPVPEITAGPALVDMRLEIDFVLSEHDFFTSNGFFEVVPAPGALALLGLAGLAGTRRRRI